MNSECRLTTVDNPYNPFTQFDQWLLFDNDHDYGTQSYLARVTNTPDDLSDEEYNAEVERAIDEIILYDFTNLYRKVRRNDYITSKTTPVTV